jgi:hypothetical protein
MEGVQHGLIWNLYNLSNHLHAENPYFCIQLVKQSHFLN